MRKNEKTGFSVLIPDGGETYALSVARCLAEEKDINTFVMAEDKQDSIRFSRHIAKFIHHPHEQQKEAKLEAIVDTIEKTKADILLPVGIKSIRLISEHKESLSKIVACPPTPDVRSFDIADDKWLLSQWLKEHHIPHPDTRLFRPMDSLEEQIAKLTFPVIVKPRNGSGGNGIHIFKEAGAFRDWYAGFDHVDDQIIQSYITGYDIDCSILCSEGQILAHTIQKSIKYSPDYPWPHGLEFLSQSEIYDIVRQVSESFRWSGVVHIDLRYDEVEKRAKLIEMNPRFWASVTASVFAGVNFPYLACLAALQMELPEVRPENKIILRTGPAIKMSLSNLFKAGNGRSYDNTFLEFILKDPLPTLIEETLYYYRKLKNS